MIAFAPNPWRPIATAPRTGAHVDLWQGRRITGCAWFDVPAMRDRLGDVATQGAWVGPGGVVVAEPSHWMPLPPPPPGT